ncbi:glycosyltransferase family protein [Haploplasma axanthum]|uniref:Uncharacterized protein n=1 Tax=Haploplasma axanthum TaxID=29552 RepID=A0A449BFC0_HAPAX|nr:hypothetical protein [Haploplasma axanthum]VEU81143.1 Uncharacterised protein [Haploplasma axanthum]
MIKYAFSRLKERKYIVQGAIFFILFLFIYSILDYLNYRESSNKLSIYLLLVNIILNILMSTASMLLLNLSTIMVELKTGGDNTSSFSFISVLIGIFTYGCTSCVIAFLSVLGITFTPTIFPLINIGNGILYKLLSFLFLIIGFTIVLTNISKGKCKVNLKKQKAKV